MKYYFILGILLGMILIIYSLNKIIKIKKLTKTKAKIIGNHFTNGRHDERISRVVFIVDNKKRESNLYYYSIFLKKGKNITIYYDKTNLNNIYCVYGNLFTLLLGSVFLFISVYLILFYKGF